MCGAGGGDSNGDRHGGRREVHRRAELVSAVTTKAVQRGVSQISANPHGEVKEKTLNSSKRLISARLLPSAFHTSALRASSDPPQHDIPRAGRAVHAFRQPDLPWIRVTCKLRQSKSKIPQHACRRRRQHKSKKTRAVTQRNMQPSETNRLRDACGRAGVVHGRRQAVIDHVTGGLPQRAQPRTLVV